MEFSFNQLSAELYTSLSQLGYSKPTEIQNKVIPILLREDIDLVGQAQTGTGKTAAFCLPLLEKIDFSKNKIQAVILSPTRELANQINQELIKFGANTPLRTATVYGGVGYKDQLANIRSAHVVVATPGRAIDLLERGKLNLSSCDYFIIDEADEMLKMGFIDDVDLLLSSLPESANKWMFSATMPKEIVYLMEQKLNDPVLIRVLKSTLSNKSITQSYSYLQKRDFFKALTFILLTEDQFYGIVFCETREDTKNLADRLIARGERAAALHGELSQSQRDYAMEQFKSRKINILVCTDVAARGVDVTDVTHVINMGLPRKPDSYVHRIGRTGRAGKVGKAISFVSPNNANGLKVIERLINDKLEKYVIPTALSTKQNKITAEIDRMSSLKKALLERKESFSIDQSFDLFNEFLSDMSREEIIKLMFSFQFNKNLKAIDEAIFNFSNSVISRDIHHKNIHHKKSSRNSGKRQSRARRYSRK